MSRIFPIAIFVTLVCAVPLHAQDDDVSLGDLARAVRKTHPVEDTTPVIDNDNLNVMMDKAEAERLNNRPVFSIDPSGKTFRMISPDGTCSLSFDAKAAALISTPYVASELPPDQLSKLEAAAVIHDGVLEVNLQNGSSWELKEIVVGLTVLNQPVGLLQPARLIGPADLQVEAKPPDSTTLYHLKATAAAGSTAVFRAIIIDDLSQGNDWHWALVSARGVAPTPAIPASLASVPAVQVTALPGSTGLPLPGSVPTTAAQSTPGLASLQSPTKDSATQPPPSATPPPVQSPASK